ncbi:hypothetical protein C8J56DRAFT_1164400 [Mycena floridula]|nr:hypothetical protein C8J56DRAFT_1164400 [Mycena floridula]
MHVAQSSRPILEPFTYNKYHVSLGPTYPISQPEGQAEAKCIMAFQEMMAEAYIASREVWKEQKERFEELGELPENLGLYGPNETQKNVEEWLAATGLVPKPEPGSDINSMLKELLAEAEAELAEASSDNDPSRPSASFRRFLLLRSLMLMSPERLWVGMQRTLKLPQLGKAIGRKTELIVRQSKSVLSLSSRSGASSRTSSRAGTPPSSRPGSPSSLGPGSPSSSTPGSPASPRPAAASLLPPAAPSLYRPAAPSSFRPAAPSSFRPAAPSSSQPATPSSSRPVSPSSSSRLEPQLRSPSKRKARPPSLILASIPVSSIIIAGSVKPVTPGMPIEPPTPRWKCSLRTMPPAPYLLLSLPAPGSKPAPAPVSQPMVVERPYGHDLRWYHTVIGVTVMYFAFIALVVFALLSVLFHFKRFWVFLLLVTFIANFVFI